MLRIRLLFIAILTLSLAVPFNASASANDYSLVIDGVTVLDRKLPPVAGIVFAPVTDTYTKLGMKTSWDADTSTATITGYGMTIELRKDSASALVNGVTEALPGAVHMRNGKLHFPVLAGSVLPDIDIRYSAASRMIYFHTPLDVYIRRMTADPNVKASANGATGTLSKQGAMLYQGGLSGGVPSGSGRMYRAGKMVYEGEFSGGLPHGRGTSVDYNGERYEGQFVSGKPEGKGKLYVNGKLTYDGDWKLGLMDGAGIEYGKNGNQVYEGEYARGQRTGYGVGYDEATGEREYAGNWLNGKQHGAGRLYDPNTQDLAFIGRFVYGKKEGEGSAVTVTTAQWHAVDGNNVVRTESRPTVYYDTGIYKADKLNSVVNRTAYTGEMLADGTPQGTGSFYRHLGSKLTSEGVLNDSELLYEGEVKNGMRHGEGQAYDGEGRLVYDGEWINDYYDGFGQAYENGVLAYRGTWSLGFRSGSGTSYEIVKPSANGSPGEAKLVSGDFRLDEPTSSASEYAYIGAVTDGMMTGTGKLYLISHGGSTHSLAVTFDMGRKGLKVYEGAFLNGLKHGVGIQFDDKGRRIYDGSFANDRREGYGTLFHETTGRRAYEGTFKDDKLSGMRGLQYSEGGAIIYDGSFDDGFREGKGKEYLDSRLLYEGDFKGGLRHGSGVEYADGIRAVYRGEYANGRREGWGIEYDQSGRPIYEGIYRNGLRVAGL